jgi:hypothetical protein
MGGHQTPHLLPPPKPSKSVALPFTATPGGSRPLVFLSFGRFSVPLFFCIHSRHGGSILTSKLTLKMMLNQGGRFSSKIITQINKNVSGTFLNAKLSLRSAFFVPYQKTTQKH